jgi:hypothetical protein
MFRGTRAETLQRPQQAGRRDRAYRVPDPRRPREARRPLPRLPARHRDRPNLRRPHVRGLRPAGRRRSDCGLDARGAHRCRLRQTGTDRLGGGRRRAAAGGSLGALRLGRLGHGKCRAPLQLDRRRGPGPEGFRCCCCRRSRLLRRRHRRLRGNAARRQKRERVDVSLLVTGRAQAEVDVRLAGLGSAARAYGSDDAAFVDVRSARDADRPQVDERRRVAGRCLNRHGLATGRHGSCEGDDTLCRSKHRAPARGAQVDAAVLTCRIGVGVVEREGPQDRSGDRPRPR